MWLPGQLNGLDVDFLVDSGVTHNFVSNDWPGLEFPTK